jgi:hypothetical protein
MEFNVTEGYLLTRMCLSIAAILSRGESVPARTYRRQINYSSIVTLKGIVDRLNAVLMKQPLDFCPFVAG